jgi:hypothetical protein
MLGLYRRWRRSWGPEAVLERRMSAITGSVRQIVAADLAMIEVLWQFEELSQHLDRQLAVCRDLADATKPAVLAELERSVRAYEAAGTEVIMASARASSAGFERRRAELARRLAAVEATDDEADALMMEAIREVS